MSRESAVRRIIRSIVVGSVLVVQGQVLNGQSIGARLVLTSDLAIDGDGTGLIGIEGAALSSDGILALGDPEELQLVFVGRDGTIRRVGRAGEGPGEFRNIREVGITPDGHVWVSDSRLVRVQMFTWEGQLRRNVKYRMRSALKDGTRLIVRPIAVVENGQLVLRAGVAAGAAREAKDGPKVGDVGVLLPGRTEDAEGKVLWMPDGPACSFRRDGLRASIPVPFCKPAALDVSPNGRVMVAAVGADHRDGIAEVRLRTWDGEGRTTERWHVRFSGRAVTAMERDEARAFLLPRLSMVPEAVKAFDAQEFPVVHAPLLGVMANDDGTVWVGLRMREQDTWVIINPNGGVRGHVMLEPGMTPVATDGDMVWTSTADDVGYMRLERLVIQ